MSTIFCTTSFLFLNFYCINSANILAVYPIPCISHQLYFRTLTLELIRRGHEVTVVTTDPMYLKETSPKNLKEVDVHDVSYKIWKKFLEVPVGKSNHHIVQMQTAYDCIARIFGEQLKIDAVKDILDNNAGKFDLLLYDGSVQIPLIFAHILKIPAVQVNSLGVIYGDYENVGAVVNQGLYPSHLSRKTTMNHFEKLYEVFYYYRNQFYIQSYIENVQLEMIRNALGVETDVRELKSNIQIMFVNLHPAWDSFRPSPMSLLYTGGMHQRVFPLPQDLQAYLDSSINGVIYMSFGTCVNASRLPPEKIQIFAKVFSELPYNVLWKWELDTMPNKSKNIMLFKWLPQSDVFKHPKVKLFTTQGGLQSTDEAITAGVPFIGIPMLGDQWFNTGKYVQYNIGLQLDLETVTEATFRNAILSVIRNNSYYTNVIHHRDLIQDQFHTALDRAAWWIDHIVLHRGSHLLSPAANIPWTEYFELELLGIVMLVLVLGISVLCFGVRFVLKLVVEAAFRRRMKLLY